MVSSAVLQGKASVSVNFDSKAVNIPEGRANIMLEIAPGAVKNYTRHGHDLIIELIDGRTLVINGFFLRGVDYHNLVFITSEGQLLTYFDKAMGGEDGIVDPLVAYEKINDDSTLALLGILGAAAAGGVAIAAAGSDRKASSDTTPPAKPSFIAIDDVAPGLGPIVNNGHTNDPQPTFHGKTEPGAIVTIYDNGKEIGKVTADEDGNWRFTPENPLEDGPHRFEVNAADKAGNVSEASAPLHVVIDTTAPAIPEIGEVHDDVESHVGPIELGGITNDARPEIRGTDAEPGSTINIYDGDDLIGTAEVDEDGAWSFTPDSDLADGPHTITISNVDQAGNESDRSAGFDFEVDTTAPAIPEIGEVHDDVESHVGPIELGGITNDARPEIRGTDAEPGSTINIYDGDDLIGTAEVDADGAWSFTPDSDLADGPHTITISNVDQAGNESDRSAGFDFEVDTTAPAIPEIGEVHDDVESHVGPIELGGITNDARPEITGTDAEPGSTINIYDGDDLIGTAEVDADGSWSFTPDSDLADGPHTITISNVDQAGNESDRSAGFDFEVDTTAPAIPEIGEVHDDVESHVGPIELGGITNDARPEIRGTDAEPGSTINIYDGDDLIGTAEVDADGSWSFTPDSDLADGPHTITISNVDQAGNESDRSAGFDFEVDTTAPAIPEIGEVHDDVESHVGPIELGGITNDARPEFTGTDAEPGSTINIYDGDDLIGTAEVDADGAWSFTPDADLDDGPHTITISSVDQAGNESDRSAGFDFEVDTTAPAIPEIGEVHDDVESHVGPIELGGITNDARPEFTGTDAEPGSTINIYDGDDLIGTAEVDEDGAWSFTPDSDLADGPHTITISNVDQAGNESDRSAGFDFEVDTTAPAIPEIGEVHDDVESHVGPIELGGITNDARPEITGTDAEPGSTINIYDGDDLIGTAEVDADGAWSFTPDADLDDGPHTITITNVDQAGNESDRSAGFAFEVDTTAPAIPEIGEVHDDVESHVGPIELGGITNDARPEFRGTDAEPGSTINIYDGDDLIGTAEVDADGAWSFTPDADLEDGPHTITISNVDQAGNESDRSAGFDFEVDTTAPAIPEIGEVHDDVESHVGPIELGGITNDARPEITGTDAEPGSTINIYDGDDLIGTAEVDADGAWSFTPDSDLDDGPHTITISNVDQAGNESDRSAGFAFEVDTTAPAIPEIGEVHDDVESHVGPIELGGITNDARPEITGTDAEPGSTINIYDGDDLIGTAEVDEDGAWSFTPDSDLADGPHTITISNVDQAGNESDRSAGFAFEVDTTAPSQLVTITAVIDDAEPVTGPVLHDGVTNDTTPRLEGTLSADLETGEKLVVLRDGVVIGDATVSGTSWFFEDLGPLDDGSYTYTAYVEGAVGNRSTVSDDYVIHVDIIQAISVNALLTGDTSPLITGSYTKELATGSVIEVVVNGVLYSEYPQGNFLVVDRYSRTWSLDNTPYLINWNGRTDETYDVEARIIDVDGNTVVVDETIDELTVFRDVTIVRPDLDNSTTQPLLIGDGTAQVDEWLSVGFFADGRGVYTFDSRLGAGQGGVIVTPDGWKLTEENWGTFELDPATTYEVVAELIPADMSTGGQTSDVITITTKNAPVTPVVPNDPERSDINSKIFWLDSGGYILMWAQNFADSSASLVSNYDIVAQEYDASGVRVGELREITPKGSPVSEGYGDRANMYNNSGSLNALVDPDGSMTVAYTAEYGVSGYIASYDRNLDLISKTKLQGAENYFGFNIVETSNGQVVVYSSGVDQNFNIYASGSEQAVPFATSQNLTNETDGANGYLFLSATYVEARPTGVSAIGPSGNSESLSAISLGGSKYLIQYADYDTPGTATPLKMRLMVMDYSDTDPLLPGVQPSTTPVHVMDASTTEGKNGWQLGAKSFELKEGGFVSLWVSNHSVATSPTDAGTMDGFGVYARRFQFNHATNQLEAIDATENRVNTDTTGVNGLGFTTLSTGMFSGVGLEQGGYVVTWARFTSFGRSEIYAQRFDAAGNKLGGETLVSTDAVDGPGGVNSLPYVAALNDGGYAITWTNQVTNFYFNDNSQSGEIMTVVFNADGTLRAQGENPDPSASYISNAGVQTGTDGVNMLDGRHGATEMRAGKGDDYIIIKDTGFSLVDGGEGFDYLIWDSPGNLDFSDIADKVQNIEAIHLGDRNANTLTLTLNDVLNMSSTTDALVIQGGSDDSVDIDLTTWRNVGEQFFNGVNYGVWVNIEHDYTSLWVQTGIAVI